MDMPIPDAKLDHWAELFIRHDIKRFMPFERFIALPEGRRQRYIDLSRPTSPPPQPAPAAPPAQLSRRAVLGALAVGAASAAAASALQPAQAKGLLPGVCPVTWQQVVASAGELFLLAAAFAQCQGDYDEEAACQVMIAAIAEITDGVCPGNLTVRDLGLAGGVR